MKVPQLTEEERELLYSMLNRWSRCELYAEDDTIGFFEAVEVLTTFKRAYPRVHAAYRAKLRMLRRKIAQANA